MTLSNMRRYVYLLALLFSSPAQAQGKDDHLPGSVAGMGMGALAGAVSRGPPGLFLWAGYAFDRRVAIHVVAAAEV